MLTPTLSRLDLADVRWVDSVFRSDDDLSTCVNEDGSDSFIGQRPAFHASACDGVGHIGDLVPVPQVFDPNTRRVITGVQDEQLGLSEMMFHHCTVCEHRAMLDAWNADASVAVFIERAGEDEAITVPDGQSHHLVVGSGSVGGLQSTRSIQISTTVLPVVVELAESLGVDDGISAYGASCSVHPRKDK